MTMEEKIAALLAKAESTDNPHEQAAYSEKAERLMIRWGIEEAQAVAARARQQGRSAAREKVVSFTLDDLGPQFMPRLMLWQAVLTGTHAGKIVHNGKRSGRVFVIESEKARTIALAESLDRQMEAAASAWWADYRSQPAVRWAMSESERFKARRQFRISFAHVVLRRLESIFAEETTAASTDLVLAHNRDKTVEDALQEEFAGRLRRGRRLAGSRSGVEAGREAGASASFASREVAR